MGYVENLKKQKEYLDKIDFLPYIHKYDDLYELYCKVEEQYNDTELSNNELLDGDIFNYITLDELATYIHERYKITYHENIVISYKRFPIE